MFRDIGGSSAVRGVRTRPGITLLELLVAMSILLLITAAALPSLAPNLGQRRIREAARQVDTFLGSARNRAMESGRPTGVLFAPIQLGAGGSAFSLPAANVLYQVEVPAPYCGGSLTSVAQVYTVASNISQGTATVYAAPSLSSDIDTSIVQSGALVQLNHQGPLYSLTGVSTSRLTLQLTGATALPGYVPPWPTSQNNAPSVPYEIFRLPIRSVATPLQLPAGTVIDFYYSGVDNPNPAQTGNTDNVNYSPYTLAPSPNNSPVFTGSVLVNGPMILFSPSGAIDSIYAPVAVGAAQQPSPASGLVHLLVGRFDRIDHGGRTPLVDDGLPNWQDSSNLWVTVSPQTGLIGTKENGAVYNASTSLQWYQYVNGNTNKQNPYAGRYIARQAKQIGGR
jgi:type II secretory pathway pseudopilin PulG